MSNKGVGIAFKLTALVLLLGILGITIGILVVTLNIRDDVEATPAPPTIPTTTTTTPATNENPPSPSTTESEPLPLCSNAPPVPPKTDAPEPETDAPEPKTTTEQPVDPVDESNPDSKNIAHGTIIDEKDDRYKTFQALSNLYEKWMDLTVDPCNDFYHYVCGKGQKNKEQSPFIISQLKDSQVESKMWKAKDEYWAAAPLPVNQAKWIKDKCATDKSFTLADQQAKLKEMLERFIGYTNVNVPFLHPQTTTTMDKTELSRLIGYGKGQFGIMAGAFLTAFVSVDFKDPDHAPYTYYVDQPLPIFIARVYEDSVYAAYKPELVEDITNTFNQVAAILNIDLDGDTIKKMAGDIVDFDRLISQMQQDPIVRRQVERNYNPHTLGELNTLTDQFDWVPFIKSAMTMLGDQANADDTYRIIIMEEDITFNKLNDLIKKTDPVIVANYVFFKALDHILSLVPAPLMKKAKVAKNRAVLNLDRRTLTGMLRKPEIPADTAIRNAAGCAEKVVNSLPWAATRMYVDTDIPNEDDRAALKGNVAEIANWIFFGFRSQLDQLNWMDDDSKQKAFDKLNNIQLNVAFPDWVADDKNLTEYYAGLDITADDNYMEQMIKLTNYRLLEEVLPIVTDPDRDRGDFNSFIGITNAWYQPQLNSITFPEGILQEPFYSPDFPLASIFGGLGSISGHELTHGFDDQGVQWDGIGALNPWMTPTSQTSFNEMAHCVIDEYSSFCPYPGVCLNGANTQGENIADNGGIQAAYKALKAYESLNGADPRLPGFGSAFNSDQLFFLTFAQTWCDVEPSKLMYQIQIATDVHSPAIYRVLGTLQNFPAFKNAFNCKANTPYTPDKHCNVWTSRPF